MDTEKIIEQLSANFLFKNARIDILRSIVAAPDANVKVCRYSASDVIVSPEMSDIPIGIIMDGTVEITSAPQTHKVILKTAGKGAMFGIANLYASSEPFPSKITAKSDSLILFIDPDTFRKMIESDATVTKNFLYFLSDKILYLNKKIASYTVGNTDAKLAYYLYENEIDGIVHLNCSFTDIAIMLDMGRASLYRSLDKFEEEDIIKKYGRDIAVTNKEKLKNYIN